MAHNVATLPEVREELDEALAWRNERSLWAAKHLLAAYDKTVGQITSRPDSFRKVHLEYRRVNMGGFPYYVIYRLREDDIFVLAVAHDRRHPDYWKHRIEGAE